LKTAGWDGVATITLVVPSVLPQLVANHGTRALRQVIADTDRFIYEP